MVLFNLMHGIEFTKEEYAIFELLCKAYIAYDPKIASFLLAVMPKKPEETNYQFSAEGLTLKWVRFPDNSGIMGAFNPLWPSTFFLEVNSTLKYQLFRTKKEQQQEEEFEKYNAESNYESTERCIIPPVRSPEDIKRQNLHVQAGWLILQFPIIMHELYHMLQFKSSKIGYVAMRFVSIFTTIPYYLFQNASWMPTFRKFFSWDIEGQAEANGDKAPHVIEFTKLIEAGLGGYEWYRRSLATAERRRRDKSMPEEEIKESLEMDKETSENMLEGATSFGKKWGKELLDLIESFVSEQ